jgi:predicted transposase/invertase (TIGR01784 family)
VDAALREHFSDLLYRVQRQDAGEAFIYLLLEHKSSPDPGTPFQLLKYMVQIWDQAHRQRQKLPLPPIVPLVLYHGKAAWKVARSFTGLFQDTAELEAYLPAFRYELCDVSHLPDEEIQGMVLLRVALLVLKYIFRPELRTRLPEVVGLLRELSDKRHGLEYVQVLFKYLTAGTDRLDAETLRNAVHAAELTDHEEMIMVTMAETWVQEGMEKGLQQGLQQGAEQRSREAVIEVLEIRFGTLPEEVLARLNRVKDIKHLKQLHRDAVKTSSLGTFMKRLR